MSTPFLVKDIVPGLGSSTPDYLTAVGNTLYFTADDGVNGRELWKSDGTAAGTVLVQDINSGSIGSYPRYLTAVGETLYFSAFDSVNWRELWKSDGTALGTVLVKDIRLGSISSFPYSLTAVGNTLYFVTDDGVNGDELWKSDGTAEGTVLVKDIRPGSLSSFPYNLTAVGNTLYFVTDDGVNGDELWKSDGTAEGTVLVKDIILGSLSSYPDNLTAVGNTLYFTGNDSVTGFELWKSDGTAEGTVLVKDIILGSISSSPSNLTAVGNTLYFSAFGIMTGEELWKSDGTAEGTVMVKDIRAGFDGSAPRHLTAVGDILYFVTDDGINGEELWKSDGTAAGTVLVKDIRPGSLSSAPRHLTSVGDTLYFVADDGINGEELWKSDGTAEGTVLVRDILVRDIYTDSYSSSPNHLTAVGDNLYFVADDGVNGRELWGPKDNGALILVKDISPGSGISYPNYLTAVGNTLYFVADDGVNGLELWKSDGTAEGTVLVKDIHAGFDGSYLDNLTAVGNTLYFSASGGVNGNGLWKSDGTAEGTVLVKNIFPDNLTVVGNTLYFAANDGVHGEELWKSDGTAEGTVLVKDIILGPGPSVSFLSDLTAVGNTLYFSAYTVANGRELWKSDGTETGTVMVQDINSRYGGSSSPRYLTVMGDSLYFVATERRGLGFFLWKSDGTAEGTVRVQSAYGFSNVYVFPRHLTAVGNTLYFVVDDGVNGEELWKSDGTAEGTVLVKDIHAGVDGSNLRHLTAVGNTLYFVADDGVNGEELWKSDGTAEGTVLVKDIHAGVDGSNLRHLTAVGNTLYFVADDGVNGEELWKSDGTAEDTVIVQDLNPGSNGSNPSNLRVVGNTLFLSADDGVNGRELWALALSNLPPSIAITSNAIRPEGNSGSTIFTFTVTRFGNATGTNDVNWAVSGTGINPASADDFVGGVLPGGVVSFAPGETSKTITVNVEGDTAIEPDETFTVTLSNPTNGAPITTATAQGTIQDDDRITLAIFATNANRPEGNSGSTPFTFTVTRSGSGILTWSNSVNWAVTSTGTNPANSADFVGGVLPSGVVSFAPGETSEVITVHVQGDTVFEGDETFTVTLSNPTNGATITTATVQGKVQDDDGSTLAISATNANRLEGNSGSTPFTFTVTRSDNTFDSNDVNWTVSGTGINPASADDFVGGVLPSGVVSFAPGETSKLITVNVQGDTTIEFNETFTVTLSNPTNGATLFTATTNAQGTIQNDDSKLAIAATNANRPEGNSGSTPFTFTVTRSDNTFDSNDVNWTVSGTGINPASADDFVGGVLPSGVVSFAPGETSEVITVHVQGDTVFEGDETFTVTLSNPTNGATITTATVQGKVQDDDGSTLAISATNANRPEGDSGSTPFTFTVTRVGNATGTNDANWAVSGTGTNPANAADFVGGIFPSGVVSFAPGETSKLITVNVQGDTTIEPNETFTVTLSNPTNGAMISTAIAQGTIISDEPPPRLNITTTNANRLEGNSGSTPFTFTVTRSDNTFDSNDVNWTVSGTGINPASADDFVGGVLPSGVVSFAPGETSKLITVNVQGDTTIEFNETFTVTLSNPTNGATLFTATTNAQGTIQNDDSKLAIAATNANRPEGNSGSTPFTFTVTRSGSTPEIASVNWTVSGTGTNPANTADFVGGIFPGGVVSFAPWETSKTIAFDVKGDTVFEPDETFTVILSNPTNGASITTATAQGTILNDDVAGLQIQSVSPLQGSNLGQTTLTINGGPFTPNAVVSIVDGNGTAILAESIRFENDVTLTATFDLQGRIQGNYDVRVVDTAGTAQVEDIFQVNEGNPGRLDVFISAPSGMRTWGTPEVVVTYRNAGNTDITAPLLTLKAEGGQFLNRGDTIQFLAISSQGNAGVLPPGATGTFRARFSADTASNIVNFTVNALATEEVVDWNAIQESSRPESIPPETWAVIFNNFVNEVGGEASQYERVLAENATRLSQLGQYTNDVSQLLAFEFQQVNAQGTFERFNLGTFGRGFSNPWEITAKTESTGNVVIQTGGSLRFFTRRSDLTYQPEPGDNGVLTQENGAFRLREADGTVLAFRTDGKLDFIRDTNNNQVTAGYTNDQLTTLTYSNGDSITFAYNPQGRISSVTDPFGQVTTYTYDGTGERLLSVSDVSGTISYTYETTGAKANAIKSITYPDGTQSLFEYDEQGRVIKQSLTGNAEVVTYAYDSAGGVTVTDALGNTSKLWQNADGQVSRIQDALGRVTEFRYDANGDLTRIIAPGNTTSAFAYDNRGNLVSATDPLGQRVEFVYSQGFNQIQTARDQRGNEIRYAYDVQGNLDRIIYADGSSETFSYNSRGDVTVSVNRRGQDIDYTYNSRGLLTRKVFADGTEATFAYDSRGNLIRATDADSDVTYGYDTANRLTSVNYGAGRTLSFSYDAGGRRTQMVDQDGFTKNYIYDSVGRLQQLTDANNANIITYSYDIAGRLVREDNGNGTYTTYGYDGAGQLLSIVNYRANNSVNSRFDYTYDALGRRTSLTTLEGTTTYSYDVTGQLTSVVLPDNRTITYQYDAAGNRIAVVDSGVTAAYTTNNLNQYTSVGTATYTYDTDGNLIAKTQGGQTSTYSYDTENRLIQVVTPEGTWRYEYDALGNRIASVKDGQRTEYLLDPTGLGDVVGEYSNGAIARYVHGLGLVGRFDGSNAASFYDTDAIGSVIGLSGSSGAYLNRYSYLPFGEDLSKTETVANPFEYVGQWGVMDEGNGLDFMRARFYTSQEGRFMNPDPIGINGGINLYQYSLNNPVSFIDPEGEYAQAALVAPVAAGVGVTAASIGAGLIVGGTPVLASPLLPLALLAGAAVAASVYYDDYANRPNINLSKVGGTPPPSSNGSQNSNNRSGNTNGSQGGNEEPPKKPEKTDPPPDVTKYKNLEPESTPNPNVGRVFDSNKLWKFGLSSAFAALFPQKTEASAQTIIRRPADPNDIVGPSGFGDQNWLTPDQVLPYTIRFENLPTATAAAVFVTITHTLDADLDLTSFELGDFGFGDLYIDIPNGFQSYTTRLDLRDTIGDYVDFEASLDQNTRTVLWKLTTIDPITGQIPDDVDAGFLPPNNDNHDGEGFVNYSITAKQNLPTGTRIDAEARIVFDTEAPINTPPIFNTIDVGEPNSAVLPLPATVGETFTVTWGGSDDGSGIASHDIFISVNGGAFTLWQDDITATSATYNGQVGSTYSFYSVAKDNVGYTEDFPLVADATVTVIASNNPPVLTDISKSGDEDNAIAFTLAEFTSAFADPDGNSLVKIQILTLPNSGILQLNGENVTLNQEIAANDLNTLTLTPDANFNGSISFSWNGFDGEVYAVNEADVSLTLNPINDLPVLTTNAGLTLAEGSIIAIANTVLQVTDVDNTAVEISYTLTNLPANGTVSLNGTALATNATFTQDDIDNNRLTYTHNSSENTADSFSFTVSDGAGGQIGNNTFNLTINPVNDAPTLQQAIPDQSAIEGQPFTFAIPVHTFADVDGDILTYSLAAGTVLPDGITFDPATRSFSGTPSDTASGSYNLTVIASDPDGEIASDTFTLQVFHPIPVSSGGGIISGTNQDDLIDASGKLGTYRLQGGGGNDLLIGSHQRDVLQGGLDNDRLYGGGDIDRLFGEEGDDLLDGGAGSDFLYGGLGADYFVLATGNGSDRIMDFNPAEGDRLALSGLNFGQLSFNSNQIILGSEVLAYVTGSLGNPVTGLNTRPEWFVTL
ncbi:ELWxxDGT repeat protein [Microcystis aeruginosa]|uniref:ELWxxDGT repeat protein n=1 Tax=Microcystis aeruginosa TaxID=1126 RepID=UPI00287F4391|nr:ELWxxDGT repeat protein [Microcystis aeruginosa]WNF14428.1 Calx-beta domain-containing protein [Microcystis aeruginosa NRERC-214]